MPNKERNLLTADERIISPEAWEALNGLMDDCLDRDVSFIIAFETGRYEIPGINGVIQGPQGFTLEIGSQSYKDGDRQRLYRSIERLVSDGLRILGVVTEEEG